MAFTINSNLVFIDSMRFMNSSLGALLGIYWIMILSIHQKSLAMIC